MADTLRLLFELNVDGKPAATGLLRFRKDIEATIAAARRAVSQPLNTTRVTAATKTALNAQQQAVDKLTSSNDRLTKSVARGSALLPQFQQRLNSIGAAALRVGGGLRSMGASMAILVSGPLLALGRAAGQSAADIDAIRNRLIATEGSLEAANARLAQLRQLADQSVGVTRRTALDTFAILATLGEVTEDTINKQIRSFGRLNAAFTIDDQQQFFRNLVQIFQQGFEIKDIREALGRVPIFEQLLARAFGTSDNQKLKQLRAAGKLTLDTFLAGMATAVETSPVLGRIQESFSVRFAKTFERIRDSLEPIGLAILGPLERIVNAVEPIIVRLATAFNQLPPGIQTAIVAVGLLTAALGPVLFVLGGVASGVGAIATAIAALLPVLAGIGLPAIAAVIAGIVIVTAEWAAILGVLGLAWRTNFLGIRETVADAASAVFDAFTRIKAALDEVAARVLPTLQSITNTVLGTVTALWERYGATVIRVISTSFEIAVRTLESFIRFFGNVIDLVAKLIDGDWRGAWQAFSRIIINALDSVSEFFDRALKVVAQGIKTIHAFLLRQAITFVQTGSELAAKLVIGIVAGLVAGAPQVRDALTQMLLVAAADFAAGPAGGVIARTIINAMRKAAAESEGISIPVSVSGPKVGADVGAGAGLFRRRRTPGATSEDGKGADAETRRRIRLLELEAERAEAIAQQRIAAENIRFEQRKTSLQDFTKFQIAEEQIVFDKKKEVFAAERAEAEKLGKGRELALGQIRLKELQAELEFANARNQLLANQEQQETEAAIIHRQALLDIQDEGDKKQLELIDSYVERYLISFEEAETRRLAIEDDARRRRRGELETQLTEAGQNVQEQQRIRDAITKLDAESATAREEAESRKRRAIKATIEAENDYFQNLQDVTVRTAQLLRDAADIQLGRLFRRFGDRRKFRLEALRLEREANEEEHQERLRQIQQEKEDAEKRLEGVRDAEEKLLQLRRFYADLEKAENERRAAERREEERREAEERDPFSSLRNRFERFRFDIEHANESISESIQSMAQQVNSVLGSMEDALQQGIVAWILYGESLGKALQKALAQQLAVLSAEFAVQALKHAAYALGSLAFGNFAGAAKHAAAAAAFTAAAAATGIAARALSKSSGLFDQGRSSSTASAATGGGAQNREFQYGGTAVEPSSSAAREGSAAPRTGLASTLMGLVAEVKQARQENALLTAKLEGTLSRIGSLPAGEVVTIGAAGATGAIGAAVIQHSKENNDFNRTLAENTGF